VSENSAIEWTGDTWNPVTGCDRVSEGCDRCYALTLAKRLKVMGNPRYQVDGSPRTSGPGFGLTVHPDKLQEPLRWRAPRPIFVNSMSDLFHDEVPAQFIEKVFNVMHETPTHVYQVLTKRPGRMASVVRRLGDLRGNRAWPLPNVWLGVSVENQRWADVRIPKLLEAPAAVRFLSCEPLLGPVDLSEYLDRLEWVIVGGESGAGFRALNLDWARSLRDQCVSASVPFFFKQVGGVTPKAGGRLLDGREWNDLPAVTPSEIIEELRRRRQKAEPPN
jgi:protein gp37